MKWRRGEGDLPSSYSCVLWNIQEAVLLFPLFTLHPNALWKKNPSLKSCHKVNPSFPTSTASEFICSDYEYLIQDIKHIKLNIKFNSRWSDCDAVKEEFDFSVTVLENHCFLTKHFSFPFQQMCNIKILPGGSGGFVSFQRFCHSLFSPRVDVIRMLDFTFKMWHIY